MLANDDGGMVLAAVKNTFPSGICATISPMRKFASNMRNLFGAKLGGEIFPKPFLTVVAKAAA